MQNYQDPIKVFTAQATTGDSQAYLVQDFRDVVLLLSTADNANLTVQVKGSIQDSIPNFAGAATASNQWDYIQLKDLEDQSSLDGDVGVVYAGTDAVRQFELNVNALKWIGISVTARVAGSVDATIQPYNHSN
jgi:NCAIR mutase (PurE)-related protein